VNREILWKILRLLYGLLEELLVVVITIIIAFHEAALAIIQLDGELLFIRGKRFTSTDQ